MSVERIKNANIVINSILPYRMYNHTIRLSDDICRELFVYGYQLK